MSLYSSNLTEVGYKEWYWKHSYFLWTLSTLKLLFEHVYNVSLTRNEANNTPATDAVRPAGLI